MSESVKQEINRLSRIARHLDKLSPAGLAWLRSYMVDRYDENGRIR